MKRTHINAAANPDGTRNVSFLSDHEGWNPAGLLMPEVENHVSEQPTNKWKKRLIDAQREASDHGTDAMRARRTQYHA